MIAKGRTLARLWESRPSIGCPRISRSRDWKKDGIRIKGRVEAELVQSCVVTLEPVTSQIDQDIDQIYVPGKLEARTHSH